MERDGLSELHQTDPIPNNSNLQANGNQNWKQAACNDCGDSPTLDPDDSSATEQHQRVGGATEEEEGDGEVEVVVVEEDEDKKQEEARSPSPPANELAAKRRACLKKRRSLFTIQAVNSNGVTERAMGEGCNAVSFGCECARVRVKTARSVEGSDVTFVLCSSSAVCGHRLGPRHEEEVLQ